MPVWSNVSVGSRDLPEGDGAVAPGRKGEGPWGQARDRGDENGGRELDMHLADPFARSRFACANIVRAFANDRCDHLHAAQLSAITREQCSWDPT